MHRQLGSPSPSVKGEAQSPLLAAACVFMATDLPVSDGDARGRPLKAVAGILLLLKHFFPPLSGEGGKHWPRYGRGGGGVVLLTQCPRDRCLAGGRRLRTLRRKKRPHTGSRGPVGARPELWRRPGPRASLRREPSRGLSTLEQPSQAATQLPGSWPTEKSKERKKLQQRHVRPHNEVTKDTNKER